MRLKPGKKGGNVLACQVGNRRCNILATLQLSNVICLSFTLIPNISCTVHDTENCAAQKSHRCPPNSECVNEPGSYRCDCKDGFEKVGATCKGKHRD